MPGEGRLVCRELVPNRLRHEEGGIGFHQYTIQSQGAGSILDGSRFFISPVRGRFSDSRIWGTYLIARILPGLIREVFVVRNSLAIEAWILGL